MKKIRKRWRAVTISQAERSQALEQKFTEWPWNKMSDKTDNSFKVLYIGKIILSLCTKWWAINYLFPLGKKTVESSRTVLWK